MEDDKLALLNSQRGEVAKAYEELGLPITDLSMRNASPTNRNTRGGDPRATDGRY